MQQLSRAALIAALSSAVLAPAAQASFTEFQSPSKNIACGMSTSFGVRCDIAEHSWPLPAKPSGPGCRELDFSGGMEVTKKGKGHFICAGDTLLRQGPVLAYGHSRSVGRWTCSSRTTGMTCRNHKNGHGFTLSRQSYRFF
jgi:hypothetical protein